MLDLKFCKKKKSNWEMEQEGQHTEEDAAMDATEEEEEEYIGARAFGISGELHPDSGPPTDGFSYLQHVRYRFLRAVSSSYTNGSQMGSETSAQSGQIEH